MMQGEFVGTFLFVFMATTGTGTALAIGVSYTVASASLKRPHAVRVYLEADAADVVSTHGRGRI